MGCRKIVDKLDNTNKKNPKTLQKKLLYECQLDKGCLVGLRIDSGNHVRSTLECFI